MKILLLATLLLLPTHAQATDPGPEALCALVWTQPLPPSRFPADLLAVKDLVAKGEYTKAGADLEKRLADILERASEALRSEKLGVEQAREFMDRYVRTKSPLLAVVGDLLVPTLPVATWAAELHCRAGNRDASVRYLRGAWRDYGREELRLALSVTLLRFGETEQAASLVPKEPVGWREKAAAGWFACATGSLVDGRSLLDQADTLSPDSQIREAVVALTESCK